MPHQKKYDESKTQQQEYQAEKAIVLPGITLRIDRIELDNQ